MSCVENYLYFDWSGHPGHVQSWTPLPKPAHFHFAVPTSHQQLLFSSVCHCQAQCLQGQRICFECGGPVKPGQLKSQGPMTTVARGREALLITEAAARQGPRAIDARVSSTSRDVARSQGENGVEEKPPLRATNALLTGSTRIAALMLYPSAMPVTPAVRFVSWAV